MDFSLPDKARLVRAAARDVLEREVFPLERVVRQDGFVASLPKLARAPAVAKETGMFTEREGSYEARSEISLIKFTVARTMQRVLDRTPQALGDLGMTDETPVAFWWAHERAARIYDGADEVHIEVVAKRLLREYGLGDAGKDGRAGAEPERGNV